MPEDAKQLELDEFEKAFGEFAKAADDGQPAPTAPVVEKTEEEKAAELKAAEDAKAAEEAKAAQAKADESKTPEEKAAEAKAISDEKLKAKAKADPEWMASLPKEAQDYIKGLKNDVSREQGRARAAREKIKELEGAKAPPKKEEAPTDFRQSESWKQITEQFPQIAKGVEDALSGVIKEVHTVKEVAGSLAKDRDESATTKARTSVSEKYEGWEEAVQSPDFEKWFGEQSPGVQALAASADPRDAILMLDRYATDTGNISARKTSPEPQKQGDAKPAEDEAAKKAAADLKAKREKQLRDAAGPAGSAPGSGERATVPDDYEAAFAVFAKKADEQMQARTR